MFLYTVARMLWADDDRSVVLPIKYIVRHIAYNMLYAERHRPRGVGLAGAVHRTWAVAEKNDWPFSNPRIDTVYN